MPIRDALPADAPAIARIHVDSWRATYRGLLPDDILAQLSYDRRERQASATIAAARTGERCCVVAEDDHATVVGFAAGGPCRDDRGFDGELYLIYLLPTAQRHGLGRQLVAAVADRLAAAEMRALILWVLRDNAPGRRFYEALGGQVIAEKTDTLGGATVVEVAYGWPDLAQLRDRARQTP